MTLGRRSGQMLRIFSADNFFKYWRYCQIYGIRNATRLAIRRLRKPMGIQPTQLTPLCLPAVGNPEDLAESINKTVSVVIPTKNAARYIRPLLEKLKCQRGVRPPQIILVDSGSTDGTVSLAERAGVTLVQIAPEKFTHAFSRNKGSEKATGDYILFTVQDALPLTNQWLWEMVTALEGNNLAAVSCAEYPRSDSDLFYQFLIQNHNQPGSANLDQILTWDKSCSTYVGIRSNTQLSDVAMLIRHDTFEKYRYQKNYAEDLDLGLRLIRDGHRLGFLRSTRILHSHHRPPYYFLKRGYVDARFLVELFSSFLYPAVDDEARLYSDVAKAYSKVIRLGQVIADLKFPIPLDIFLEKARSVLLSEVSTSLPDDPVFDPELHKFIGHRLTKSNIFSSKSPPRTNIILPHLVDYLERLGDWISGAYDLADDDLACDVVRAMYKAFALYTGTHLAYLYLTLASRGKVEHSLAQLDQMLVSGV